MTSTTLVVDDDAAVRKTICRVLDRSGFSTVEAGDLADARRRLGSDPSIDAVVLDLGLPDGSGLDFLPEVRDQFPDLALVVLTGQADIAKSVEAMKRGADHFLPKPVGAEELIVVLRRSLEIRSTHRTTHRRRRLERRPVHFWGTAPAMVELRALAERTAASDSPVLLLGETGTGKGLLARWIHDHGPRPDAPFVEVNCSALRGEMLANELFGHARGAFTSAFDAQAGLLDVADGGTLFLDEIGEMDPSLQGQFLKVLEEKRYRRLGETRERRSAFRLLCATNRRLEGDLETGRFRSDLYYRIDVFPVEIPALRHRLDDVGPLVQHLLGSFGDPSREIHPNVFPLLLAYPWPGNVRELRNVLERARLLAGPGRPLTPEHFPGLHRRPAAAKAAGLPAPRSEELDESRIAAAIRLAGGNRTKAAEILGISRATLYRRMP